MQRKRKSKHMRAKALERVGKTRKRVVGDDVSEEAEKKEKEQGDLGRRT